MATISLPAPEPALPLAGMLRRRRSTKAMSTDECDLDVVAELLWCATGVSTGGRRTHPSAHAHYPVTLTLVAGAVPGLEPGGYRYDPVGHSLAQVAAGDHRRPLADLTLDAPWLAGCPVVVVLSVDPGATADAFSGQGPERGRRFAAMEMGAISQNLYLWAASRGLGTVLIGGLGGDLSSGARGLLPERQEIWALHPVGHEA